MTPYQRIADEIRNLCNNDNDAPRLLVEELTLIPRLRKEWDKDFGQQIAELEQDLEIKRNQLANAKDLIDEITAQIKTYNEE